MHSRLIGSTKNPFCSSFFDLESKFEGHHHQRTTSAEDPNIPPATLSPSRILMYPRGLRSRAYMHRRANVIIGPVRDCPRSKSIASWMLSKERKRVAPSGSHLCASSTEVTEVNGESILDLYLSFSLLTYSYYLILRF